jgi:hypothetical protein
MALLRATNNKKRIQLKELFDLHYPKILSPFDIEHYSFTAHNDSLENAEIRFPGCLLIVQFKKAEDYTAYLNDNHCIARKAFKQLLTDNRLVNYPDDIQVFGINNFKEIANFAAAI